MERARVVAVLAVVALVAATGCTGVLGSDGAQVVIERAEGPQGQTFVYVQPTDGQLPAGTEITVEHTLSGGSTVSGTLERPANEGTRVYLGGPLASESVTEFRYGMAPSAGLVPHGVNATVTVTVDDGTQRASETFAFEK